MSYIIRQLLPQLENVGAVISQRVITNRSVQKDNEEVRWNFLEFIYRIGNWVKDISVVPSSVTSSTTTTVHFTKATQFLRYHKHSQLSSTNKL
jgi:hypothetical protein